MVNLNKGKHSGVVWIKQRHGQIRQEKIIEDGLDFQDEI